MARRKRAGRPKGSKNKNKIETVLDKQDTTLNRRGRLVGIVAKRRGRPAGTKTSIQSLLTPGSIQGIHFIGKTLIVDTNQMELNEVIFLGEGKQPKVR